MLLRGVERQMLVRELCLLPRRRLESRHALLCAALRVLYVTVAGEKYGSSRAIAGRDSRRKHSAIVVWHRHLEFIWFESVDEEVR